MTVTLRMDILGNVQVNRRLLRFERAVLDASEAFEAMAKIFYANETDLFDAEGSGFPWPWPALADSTKAEKARHGWDPRILHRTLALRESLTSSDAPGSVHEITPDSLFLGTDIPYAKYHQQAGYMSSWLPMRKPVQLKEETKRALIKAMQAHIIGVARGTV